MTTPTPTVECGCGPVCVKRANGLPCDDWTRQLTDIIAAQADIIIALRAQLEAAEGGADGH